MPRIVASSPDSVLSGSAGISLVITGTGFRAGMIVRWNGAARETAFRSSTQLAAVIPATDLVEAADATVLVFDPATGLASNAVAFRVVGRPEPLLLGPLYPSLFSGDTTLLKLRRITAAGDTLTAGLADWSSAAPQIASVDQTGIVTGVAPGLAVVTAIRNGVSVSVTVAVIGRPVRPTRRLAYLVDVPQAQTPPTFFGALTVAQADGTGAVRLSPDDEDVYNFAWSPDGQRLALTVYHWVHDAPNHATGTPSSYTMTSDGTDRRPLPVAVFDPEWSPDGTRLAYEQYVSISDRAEHIFTMPASGGSPREVTSGSEVHTQPHWSPDGRQIAYFVMAGDGTSDLRLVAADGSNVRRLVLPSRLEHVAWSPDGKYLAATSGAAVWLVSAADGSFRQLAGECSSSDGQLCGGIRHPAWSRDGHTVAFGRGVAYQSNSIAFLDLATGRETDVAIGICCYVENMSLDWSPDGSLVAYQGTFRPSPDALWSAVGVVAANGSNPHAISGAVHAFRPRWQP